MSPYSGSWMILEAIELVFVCGVYNDSTNESIFNLVFGERFFHHLGFTTYCINILLYVGCCCPNR